MGLARQIEKNWYGRVLGNAWLLPLVPLVWLVVTLKRRRFLRNPPAASAIPVVVVGNITVGGTGKTPLITYLVARARALGFNPAIVSRGYGGNGQYPLLVNDETPVSACGDEPKLLASRLNCPVAVDPQRARAVAELAGKADLIFSDDGLQHYAMARQREIVVVDASRGFGNGWLLPAGPLREPVSRIDSVDLVLANGRDFRVSATALVNAKTGEVCDLATLNNTTVHAVSGIGNPQRFYDTLTELGARVVAHAFPDHHAFAEQDFDFPQASAGMVVMTEKDWVKCRSFAQPDWWYLAVDAQPAAQAAARIDELLLSLKRF
ncbi:tetraacyldisaccharide 4'-kinase [Thalassolituus sp. LLYu03]|uniref:tetraacyldisaccharide 4'-kinase n=1 Tax=Thalassolituus sp. LLYu03 TaxID=3421656 RepID=UPI003D2E302C